MAVHLHRRIGAVSRREVHRHRNTRRAFESNRKALVDEYPINGALREKSTSPREPRCDDVVQSNRASSFQVKELDVVGPAIMRGLADARGSNLDAM